MAAPTEVGMLMNSRPRTISGVALKLPRIGGCWSRQSLGFSLFSDSKITRELAQTSPRPGMVRLRKASADFHRHASFMAAKLSAVSCVRGEYLLDLRSPP